jgi:hypothetical protein
MEGLEFIEGQVSKIQAETGRLLAQAPHKPVPLPSHPAQTPAESASAASPLRTAVDLLKTIPGVDKIAAAILVAEIGVNMNQFPTPGHLASWAGLCPGNNESAGKRLSGTTRNGSVWLRRALCQAAWAASRTRKTYLSALYRRLIVRKGKKKTIVAVAHTILVIAYHIIKNQQPYQELGADYFDRLDQKALERSLVKRLTNLGYHVTLTQTSTQASG